MTWHLVNYADDKFKPQQEFLERVHSENFNIISYNREWLVTTDYYKDKLCWIIYLLWYKQVHAPQLGSSDILLHHQN